MSIMALCSSLCISAFLSLPRRLRLLWHYLLKGRQKKEPPLFASIILRARLRKGDICHTLNVRPSFASPALVCRVRCLCGRVGA